VESAQQKVLIVDDEPRVCELIRDGLSEHDFDCSICTDGRQAAELLDGEHFAVLVADISMPGFSGLDLLTHARRHAGNCKVILITGISRQEYLAQALILGAYDYIEKPFSVEQLAEAVARAASDSGGVPQLPARAASAIRENAHAVQAALHGTRALARAVEAKDPYTRRHSDQVTHYATHLGKAVHIRQDLVEPLRIASLLHDVGKISVPDHILTKPGPLTEAEFEHIRRHPSVGADILSAIHLFEREARIVRHHHENWDGRGYPDGLTGEQIPLGARIIRVADAMDAMLMDRSYKRSYPVQKMLDELIRCAGTQFDPGIARAAVQWCRANPEKLILPDRQAQVT